MVVTVYDIDNAVADVDQAAMTFVNNNTWKYTGWTPDNNGPYLITFENRTLDVKYFLYANVVGALTGVPGGSGTGSTLATLRARFLKMSDNYNAEDLTGTNSSGELADICIDEALQTIYSDIKNSRYLDAYASTALVSVADQSYIELSAISDLDELLALKDTTNQISLIEVPAWKYFQDISDPSISTGTSYRYCRIFNRIYLDPRPTSAITYTTEYKKTYARLSSDSDTALIPSKFNPWIYEEARVKWLMGEDINNAGAIQIAQAERNRVREIALADIGSQFNEVSVSASHFRKRRFMGNHYTHI